MESYGWVSNLHFATITPTLKLTFLSGFPGIFNVNVAKFNNFSLAEIDAKAYVRRNLYVKLQYKACLKHVASENGPLVLLLQSFSQIFIVKHID